MDDKQPNFRLYARHTGIAAPQLEYDWRMCDVVNRIFADTYLKSHLLLFGGTMLCRVYKICHRISTDVDLAYSIDTRGISRNTIRATEKEMAHHMMTDYIAPVLGTEYKCTFDASAPTMINVSYQSVLDGATHSMGLDFKSGFWEPNKDTTSFTPIIHTNTLPQSTVRTVSLEQMFWIKLAVLHCYHHLPETKGIHPTSSRHYYDVFCMTQHGVNLQDKRGKLLQNVIKTNLMPLQKRKWAGYSKMTDQVNLMPAPHIMDALRRDYEQYSKQIYGARPTWMQIMSAINRLQQSL